MGKKERQKCSFLRKEADLKNWQQRSQLGGLLAAGLCVDIHGSYDQQGPGGCLETGSPPVIMLVSEGCTTTGAMLALRSFGATQVHGDIQTQTAAEGCVWVHDPAGAGFCVDISDSCCY